MTLKSDKYLSFLFLPSLNRKAFTVSLLALCLVAAPLLLAQKRNKPISQKEKLQQERKKKEAEIALTKNLLSKTEKEKDKSINHLRILNRQIKIREELIESFAQEISGIEEQLGAKLSEVQVLSSALEDRKKEYGDMLFVSQKLTKSFHPFSFLLSSGNFNQAIKRLRFMRDLSGSRNQQLQLITKTQTNLKTEITQLTIIKEEKAKLLGQKSTEKQNLEIDKQEGDKILKSLQVREADLKKQLAAKQKAAKELDAKLQKLIREEIERARRDEQKRLENSRKAGKSATKTETASGMTMTPEAAALSSSFNSNLGKLPWPVEKGFIIRGFGEQPHPTLQNIKIMNNGIDIATTDGSQARAVFDGEVRAVMPIPGMQHMVMINHGEFFTVYTHVNQPSVQKGDKVKIKQNIGSIHKAEEDNKTILHFELWKGSTKQDPENWLSSK